jgi:hypothetical protein
VRGSRDVLPLSARALTPDFGAASRD